MAYKISDHRRKLVDALKDHAERHQDVWGWSVIVNSWTDEEIAKELDAQPELGWKTVRSPNAAIARFAQTVVPLYEEQDAMLKEVEAERRASFTTDEPVVKDVA